MKSREQLAELLVQTKLLPQYEALAEMVLRVWPFYKPWRTTLPNIKFRVFANAEQRVNPLAIYLAHFKWMDQAFGDERLAIEERFLASVSRYQVSLGKLSDLYTRTTLYDGLEILHVWHKEPLLGSPYHQSELDLASAILFVKMTGLVIPQV